MRTPNTLKKELVSNNDITKGKSIEEEMRIAESTKIPIQATAPTIYTARKDGVLAETNIRTDRWEIAQKAMDSVSKSFVAKRMEQIERAQENNQNAETTTAHE